MTGSGIVWAARLGYPHRACGCHAPGGAFSRLTGGFQRAGLTDAGALSNFGRSRRPLRRLGRIERRRQVSLPPMKTISAFLLSALVALAAILVAIALLAGVCRSNAPDGTTRTTPRLPIHYQGELPDGVIERAVMTRENLDRLLWNVQAAPAQAQVVSWWQRFICDIRITDMALIGFALFLLLATVFQGVWMLGATRASDRTSNLVNEGLISAQRAYVFLREFQVALTKNPLNDEIQTCTIQPIWENTGTTPTRNGRGHVNWKYFDRSVPPISTSRFRRGWKSGLVV